MLLCCTCLLFHLSHSPPSEKLQQTFYLLLTPLTAVLYAMKFLLVAHGVYFQRCFAGYHLFWSHGKRTGFFLAVWACGVCVVLLLVFCEEILCINHRTVYRYLIGAALVVFTVFTVISVCCLVRKMQRSCAVITRFINNPVQSSLEIEMNTQNERINSFGNHRMSSSLEMNTQNEQITSFGNNPMSSSLEMNTQNERIANFGNNPISEMNRESSNERNENIVTIWKSNSLSMSLWNLLLRSRSSVPLALSLIFISFLLFNFLDAFMGLHDGFDALVYTSTIFNSMILADAATYLLLDQRVNGLIRNWLQKRRGKPFGDGIRKILRIRIEAPMDGSLSCIRAQLDTRGI